MGAQPVVCRDLVELVTEYLDEALPPDLHAAVGRHLAGCVGCVEYVRQLLFPGRLRKISTESRPAQIRAAPAARSPAGTRWPWSPAAPGL
jgi:hypothetical protein